jgi:hypothetical protein
LTSPTSRLRDGQVFRTAISLAASREASTPARVFAIRVLVWAVWPNSVVGYDDLTGPRCVGDGPSLHVSVAPGAPLPSDYFQQVRALIEQVTSDTTAPPDVRRAATCARILRPLPGLVP